jgi:hypothetical protein
MKFGQLLEAVNAKLPAARTGAVNTDDRQLDLFGSAL